MANVFNKIGVSIHASVKDATNSALLAFIRTNSFNPRICKRCDHNQIQYQVAYPRFQSTHL